MLIYEFQAVVCVDGLVLGSSETHFGNENERWQSAGSACENHSLYLSRRGRFGSFFPSLSRPTANTSDREREPKSSTNQLLKSKSRKVSAHFDRTDGACRVSLHIIRIRDAHSETIAVALFVRLLAVDLDGGAELGLK
jgi:hypothetical protein